MITPETIHNILVIGNGFDLYHGLKTKYIDFVNYTRNIKEFESTKKIRGIINNNIFINWFMNVAQENQGWIDCEKEIENIIVLLKKIIFDKDIFTIRSNEHYILLNETSLSYSDYNMIGEFYKFIRDYSQSGYRFEEKYFTKYQGINKLMVLNELRSDLEDMISVFKYYLQNEVINKELINISPQISNIRPEYVINFNYTNTYNKYGIRDDDVCFIHGSVDKNNIILGIKDIDENDIDFIYFKKFFQRIQKKSDIIDLHKIRKEDSGSILEKHYVHIHFFGHSFSNTDGDIIRSICDYASKIIIYYVNNKDNTDYEQKVINVIDVLGKENSIQGINTGRIEFLQIE